MLRMFHERELKTALRDPAAIEDGLHAAEDHREENEAVSDTALAIP
jgi:hypothetical protein